MSTLEDIANGVSANVFTAGSNEALAALSTDIFAAICANGRRSANSNELMSEIVNRFVFEAASKYKNKFMQVPNWLPNYKKWKEGQIPYFTYERRQPLN